MTSYNVSWEIDVDAASPRSAAEFALGVQRSCSSATVFTVSDEHGNQEQVDLWEDGEDDADYIVLEQGEWTDE